MTIKSVDNLGYFESKPNGSETILTIQCLENGRLQRKEVYVYSRDFQRRYGLMMSECNPDNTLQFCVNVPPQHVRITMSTVRRNFPPLEESFQIDQLAQHDWEYLIDNKSDISSGYTATTGLIPQKSYPQITLNLSQW